MDYEAKISAEKWYDLKSEKGIISVEEYDSS